MIDDLKTELAYFRRELEDLRSTFSEGEPEADDVALSKRMIAKCEDEIRKLETLLAAAPEMDSSGRR